MSLYEYAAFMEGYRARFPEDEEDVAPPSADELNAAIANMKD